MRAEGPCRPPALGGEPMDGSRHIWWNFVSSSKYRMSAGGPLRPRSGRRTGVHPAARLIDRGHTSAIRRSG
ncbi:MAG: hypothetical protein ACREE5_10525 [Acetobacteraceae bacterium]